MNIKKIVDFIFELGQLKKIPHQGWYMIGVDNPETVGVHNIRAAQIGYFLAKLENYKNPYEVVTLIVFHDIEECRIGDFHKVAYRYIKVSGEEVVDDQINDLDKFKELKDFWVSVKKRSTIAGNIAKDAEILEQAFTAKELLEKGYQQAQDWINNVEKRLQTKSAKDLFTQLKKSSSNDWWQGLKKIPKK
ncbi:MAG: hypothetical protein Fur009_7750 [Candidatus Microgenomates bacterium]